MPPSSSRDFLKSQAHHRLEPIWSSILAQSETLPPNHIKSFAQFRKCQNPHAIKSKPTPKYSPSEFLKPNLNQETTQPVRSQATNIPKYFLTPNLFQISIWPQTFFKFTLNLNFQKLQFDSKTFPKLYFESGVILGWPANRPARN